MNRNVKIGIIALLVLLLSVYYFGMESKYSTRFMDDTPSFQTEQNANQIPIRGSVLNQEQCAADGKVFFRTHWSDSENPGPSSWTYDGPEYHSSQNLKTCLVYIGETSPLNNNAFSTHHNLYVYDIYANQSRPILQSSTDRTCPSRGQCTETPGDPITFFSNTPNLSTNDFIRQKDILFNQ